MIIFVISFPTELQVARKGFKQHYISNARNNTITYKKQISYIRRSSHFQINEMAMRD